ncbi:MAG: hypothetical protein RLZZ502_841 [Pseudomonadota bacterium]|jgi:hypothetical protein
MSYRLLCKIIAGIFGLLLTTYLGFAGLWTFFEALSAYQDPKAVAEKSTHLGYLLSVLCFALGVTGYWGWVFLRRTASQLWRYVLAALIAVGCLPLLFLLRTETAVLIFPLAISAVLITWLCRPHSAGNPNKPDHSDNPGATH